MQTVWSRVSQARCICNCPSCRLTPNAITRRTTTVTARRTIRVGDIYTVSLSSLAAGLAFADSRKKDARRKQWDKVIEEIRERVEATEIQQQSRLAALSDEAIAKALETSTAPGYDATTEKAVGEPESWDEDGEKPIQLTSVPDDRNDNWLDVFDWAREQHKIREASGFQDWKGPPLSLLQSLSGGRLKELLSNEGLLRQFHGGPDCNSLVDEQSKYRFSTKKIRTLEWSLVKMVLKLLSHCMRYSEEFGKDRDRPADSLLREYFEDGENVNTKLDHVRERLRTLHADRRSGSYYDEFESPQIPNYYDEITMDGYDKQTNEMNIFLRKLLDIMKRETDLSELVSKIAYNLLTARTPPNTHTYNMLLVRFCALEKVELVKAVLSSMRESHVRPNEITHATLLRHFTVSGNLVGFVHYCARMEGYKGGLALANPQKDIHPLARTRHVVKGRNHHRIVEKARMNGEVYESLIAGALRFFSSQTAMHYYRNMISEGWSPTLGVLLAILQDCCRRLDWTVGKAVLEQLEKIANKSNTLTYEWMLRLCQCCGQQEVFDQILRTGVHCGALPAMMLDLPDHVKGEDVGFLVELARDLQSRKALSRGEKANARMRYHIDDRSPFLLENVMHVCEDKDVYVLRNTIERLRDGWQARLALRRRLDVLSASIDQIVIEVNHVLYASKHPSRHLASVKFWLSGRIRHLEKEDLQDFNRVAYASYRDVVRDKLERPQGRSAKDREGESGSPERLQTTSDILIKKLTGTRFVTTNRQRVDRHLLPPREDR